MSAIVTTKFRIENAAAFIGSTTSLTDSIYLGIGKSDPWPNNDTPPSAYDDITEENDFWQNVIAFKKVTGTDVTHIAKRYSWDTEKSYEAWDDTLDDIYDRKFYTITSNNQVYKCIIAGAAPATQQPNHTSTSPEVVFYSDGYAWQYICTIPSDVATQFLMTSYMPVKVAEDATGNVTEQSNYDYQENCKDAKGKIYRYAVTHGGNGYLTPPTVTVYGNGINATATAVLTGTSVSSIIVEGTEVGNVNRASNMATNSGSGYTVAYVEIAAPPVGAGNTTATARAVLSPGEGHGTDPVTELGAYYVGIRTLLTGAEGNGDFIVNNLFRQIGIVKNPYTYGSSTVASEATVNALKTINLGSSPAATYAVDPTRLLVQTGPVGNAGVGATAYIDSVETVGGNVHIKYHQNDNTGYKAFTSIGVIQQQGNAQSDTISSLIIPDVQPFSGKVLFVENRAAISRQTSQIEDIRVILEF